MDKTKYRSITIDIATYKNIGMISAYSAKSKKKIVEEAISYCLEQKKWIK